MSKENKNQVEVKVLDMYGNELPATMRNGKVRKLLKEEKAKVIKKNPFTIQLLYDINNNDYDGILEYQPIILKYTNSALKFEYQASHIVPILNSYENEENQNSAIVQLKKLAVKHKNKIRPIIEEWKDYDWDDIMNVAFRRTHYMFNALIENGEGKNSLSFPQIVSVCFDIVSTPFHFKKYYESSIEVIDDACRVIRNKKSDLFKNIFKKDYNKLLSLLNDLKADLVKVYAYYEDFMRDFELINLIVTDRNIVPNIRKGKSICISCADFEKLAKTINFGEDEDEQYAAKTIYSLYYNVYIDCVSYFKDNIYRIEPNNLWGFYETKYFFYNTDDVKVDTFRRNDYKLLNPAIYDIDDTYTIEEMYEHNHEVITDKSPYLYSPNHTHGTFTYDNMIISFDGEPKKIPYEDLFKPDYKIHINMVFYPDDIKTDTTPESRQAYINMKKHYKEKFFADDKYVIQEESYGVSSHKDAYKYCQQRDCETTIFLDYGTAEYSGSLYSIGTTKKYNAKDHYSDEYEKYNIETVIDKCFLITEDEQLVDLDECINVPIDTLGQPLEKTLTEAIKILSEYKTKIEQKDIVENKNIILGLAGSSVLNYDNENDYCKMKGGLPENLKTEVLELYNYIKVNGQQYGIYISKVESD